MLVRLNVYDNAFYATGREQLFPAKSGHQSAALTPALPSPHEVSGLRPQGHGHTHGEQRTGSLPVHRSARFPERTDLATEMATFGITLERDTAESFCNEGVWRYEAITPSLARRQSAGERFEWLGTNCSNLHVQPTGAYHYPGLPEGPINRLGKGPDGATDTVMGGFAVDAARIRHLRRVPFQQRPRPRHHPNEACHSTSCWSCFMRALWCRAARKMSSSLGLPSKIPGREYRASMSNCASRCVPTQACCHHSSMRPRASAMAREEGSRSLLRRLMLPRAGSRFQRSLLRQRAQGKQWLMCGEDLIRDADHTQVSANPPSRNCFARSSATLVS